MNNKEIWQSWKAIGGIVSRCCLSISIRHATSPLVLFSCHFWFIVCAFELRTDGSPFSATDPLLHFPIPAGCLQPIISTFFLFGWGGRVFGCFHTDYKLFNATSFITGLFFCRCLWWLFDHALINGDQSSLIIWFFSQFLLIKKSSH